MGLDVCLNRPSVLFKLRTLNPCLTCSVIVSASVNGNPGVSACPGFLPFQPHTGKSGSTFFYFPGRLLKLLVRVLLREE